MISLALPIRSWAHRVRAPVKLVGLLVLSIALFPVDDLRILAVVLLVVVALTASLGTAAQLQTLRFLVPLTPVIVLLMLYHFLFGEIRGGWVITLRLVSLILMANFVTMTTALSEMMELMERVLAPLQRLGVNARAISVAMGLVIRFTPVLLARSRVLHDSWRARSAKSPRWNLIVPIGLSAFDDADAVSEALRARGGVNQLKRSS